MMTNKNVEYPNKNGDLVNCLGCGRDTRSHTGYCYRCSGHTGFAASKGQIHDSKDRKIERGFGDTTDLYNENR